MLTQSPSTFLSRHITIIDDDFGTARDTSEMVTDLGYFGEIIQRPPAGFSDTEQLISALPSDIFGVLCDHRLQNGGFASFFGSEFVAKLSERCIPSVLITQFTETDADTSIRLYRKKIPSLLKRVDLTPESIQSCLIQCQSELSGNLSARRIPYRTLIRVTNFTRADSTDVVDAFIPSWKPRISIRFPTDLVIDENVKERIHSHDYTSGSIRLFAQVNIGAENTEDLFFDQFEWTEQ